MAIADRRLNLQEILERRDLADRSVASSLAVAIDWDLPGAVSRALSLNAPFALTITLTNASRRDAEDLRIELLVGQVAEDVVLRGGEQMPGTETLDIDGAPVDAWRHARRLQRVGGVPQQVSATAGARLSPTRRRCTNVATGTRRR